MLGWPLKYNIIRNVLSEFKGNFRILANLMLIQSKQRLKMLYFFPALIQKFPFRVCSPVTVGVRGGTN